MVYKLFLSTNQNAIKFELDYYSLSLRTIMTALDFVGLTPLMKRTSGNAAVKIGLIDGPILANHPDLTSGHVSEIPGTNGAACNRADSTACMHGTFVAGILFANRNSQAPAICPNCTLIVRPVFSESKSDSTGMPSSTPDELAAAVIECIESGARVINLSLALARPSIRGEKALEEAFDYAAKRQVIVVAASGNYSPHAPAPWHFLNFLPEPQ